MIVDVDCESGSCELIDPGTFTAFSVSSDGTDSQLVGSAMGRAGYEADEADHLWVSIDRLIEAAAGDPEWRSGFDGMVGYATSKGWTNESGTHIRAHLENRPRSSSRSGASMDISDADVAAWSEHLLAHGYALMPGVSPRSSRSSSSSAPTPASFGSLERPWATPACSPA